MAERDQSAVRLDELLLRRATEQLSAEDEAALRALLEAHPDADEYRYERAAAAVLLASLRTIEPMPAALQHRLAAQWRTSKL